MTRDLFDTRHPEDSAPQQSLQDALRGADALHDDSDFVVDTPADWIRTAMIAELYHATLAAFTQPEPRDITQCSEVSVMLLTTFGMPDAGRELGGYVQRWRDDANTAALCGLHAALKQIEQENEDD